MNKAHVESNDLFGFESPEVEPLPPGTGKKYDRHGQIRGKHYVEPRGYAGTPGKGKEGETCKSRAHYSRVAGGAKCYPKCFLMKAHWTHGRGSGILARPPGCPVVWL